MRLPTHILYDRLEAPKKTPCRGAPNSLPDRLPSPNDARSSDGSVSLILPAKENDRAFFDLGLTPKTCMGRFRDHVAVEAEGDYAFAALDPGWRQRRRVGDVGRAATARSAATDNDRTHHDCRDCRRQPFGHAVFFNAHKIYDRPRSSAVQRAAYSLVRVSSRVDRNWIDTLSTDATCCWHSVPRTRKPVVVPQLS